MSEDPRALRSRALLQFAVRDLLATEELAALTVSAVCRRAGLHRTTFYQHYHDLSACITDAVVDPVARDLAQAIKAGPVPWRAGVVDTTDLAAWVESVRSHFEGREESLEKIVAGGDASILRDLAVATASYLDGAAEDQPSIKMRLRATVAVTVLADEILVVKEASNG